MPERVAYPSKLRAGGSSNGAHPQTGLNFPRPGADDAGMLTGIVRLGFGLP